MRNTGQVLQGGSGKGEPGVTRRWVVRVMVGVAALAAGLGVGVALAGSGGLDPSFGTGGTTVLEHPTSTYPTPMGLTPAGKVVAVSTSEGVITVSRLLASGAPDPSFDGDGVATIEEPGFPSAHAVAIEPDGKIVIVGFKNVGSNEEDAMVWRLKADGGPGAVNGALDPTFGTGGAVALKPDTDNVGNAVAIQPDGKVLVTGSIFNLPSGKNTAAVWRLTEAGTLDTSFDTDGLAELSDAHEDQAEAIALAPDGRIVIAGDTTDASNPPDVVVWRLKPNGGAGELNGARDTSFDTDGQADIDSGGEDRAFGVTVQPDGKIVVVGRSDRESHSTAMVWRLKVNGGPGGTSEGLDPTFDTDGAAQLSPGGFAGASAVTVQPDGKILVAGYSEAGSETGAAVVWRLASNGGTGAANGALDPTFGTGGMMRVTAGAGASANALALGPDRRIVVAGSTFSENLLVFRALGDPFSLAVTKAGTGSGSVQSSPAGISCGAVCSGPFDDGALVTLDATPAAGSAFAGWSGAGCSGTGACSLTMSADRAVTANFGALPVAHAAPKITNLKQSHASWREGSKRPKGRKRVPRGTTFTYSLDQQATVRFAFTQRVGGRRVKGRCLAQTPKNRHGHSCRRTVTRGTLSVAAHAGMNKLSFLGQLGHSKRLLPGRYTLIVTAENPAGLRAKASSLSFSIVR
jgi:uncharacterized delta-60 repeat protein